jgi:ABC-type transporter Mla subunit MlaD
MKKIASVPILIYEDAIKYKNRIITALIIIILLLIISLGAVTYSFVQFIGSYDYTHYSQDGSGINNINNNVTGDVENESNIKH